MAHAKKCVAVGVLRFVGGAVARQCEIPISSSSRASCLLNVVQLRSLFGESRSALSCPALNYFVQANRFSCCAKVDLPPPREITVEYQEKPENTDYFIQLADKIENANPELMVLGNPDDIQPRDGSFEVTSGKHVLFSKLQAKRLPRVEEILLALEQLPANELSCGLEAIDKAATA